MYLATMACSREDNGSKESLTMVQHDPVAKKLMELAAYRKTIRFWVEDDLLLTTGRRVYVFKLGSIMR